MKTAILIDLGNSETRMRVMYKDKVIDTCLSNKYATLPSGYRIAKDYKNNKSTVLCINGGYYAHGQLAEREFEGKLIRPTAIAQKTDQPITNVTLNLVLINAIMQIANIEGIKPEDVDATFNISVLLPPMEQEMRSDKMVELVKSIKSVTVHLPEAFTKDIMLNNVTVLPEGVAAFFGVYYTEDTTGLVEAKSNTNFATGNVLVLDIGAGTTDIVLIKDTQLVMGSKETIQKGGNTVEANLKKAIHQNHGFRPNEMGSIVQSGYLLDGGNKIDIVDLLTEAKRGYSQALLPEIMTYLEGISVSMREVKGILVVGGGSLPTIRDGKEVSPAMASVLLDYFKELSPNIQLVNLDNKNPRLLNIQGLYYIQKYSGEEE